MTSTTTRATTGCSRVRGCPVPRRLPELGVHPVGPAGLRRPRGKKPQGLLVRATRVGHLRHERHVGCVRRAESLVTKVELAHDRVTVAVPAPDLLADRMG